MNEPADSDQQQGNEGPAPWRRRVGFVVLVVGIAAIALRLLHLQPVAVDVVYHLNPSTEGRRLVSAMMRYHQEGEEIRRVSFRYANSPARETQRHRVSLPRGEYRVHVELAFVSVRSRAAEGARPAAEGTPVVVRRIRPLIVSGPGRVDLFVR